jgi:excisionase family DNA binding protein
MSDKPCAEIRTNPPKLLSPSEAAFALGISDRHLANLTAEGVLPRIKLGRRVLYRWSQLEAALAKLEGKG